MRRWVVLGGVAAALTSSEAEGGTEPEEARALSARRCLKGTAFHAGKSRQAARKVLAEASPEDLSKAIRQMSSMSCQVEAERAEFATFLVGWLHTVRRDVMWGAATALGHPPTSSGLQEPVDCERAKNLVGRSLSVADAWQGLPEDVAPLIVNPAALANGQACALAEEFEGQCGGSPEDWARRCDSVVPVRLGVLPLRAAGGGSE